MNDYRVYVVEENVTVTVMVSPKRSSVILWAIQTFEKSVR